MTGSEGSTEDVAGDVAREVLRIRSELAALARGVFPAAQAPTMWNDVLKLGLDPDLEANRSWSLCAKAREQRRRNMDRAKDDAMFWHKHSLGKLLRGEH